MSFQVSNIKIANLSLFIDIIKKNGLKFWFYIIILKMKCGGFTASACSLSYNYIKRRFTVYGFKKKGRQGKTLVKDDSQGAERGRH
jgi:hypothetical protein